MKNTIIAALVAALVGGVVGYFASISSGSELLGATSKPIEVKYSFNQGIAVKGTDVFTSARVLSATDATLAGDVTVDDDNTTSTVSVGNTGVGKLCLYNGTNFSIISFASNSTSTSISTSTSCN